MFARVSGVESRVFLAVLGLVTAEVAVFTRSPPPPLARAYSTSQFVGHKRLIGLMRQPVVLPGEANRASKSAVIRGLACACVSQACRIDGLGRCDVRGEGKFHYGFDGMKIPFSGQAQK